MIQWDERSLQRLEEVHPDLAKVCMQLAKDWAFDYKPFILEGLRTRQRQAQLVATGASTTMRSRHLTGHAVDIAPMFGKQVRWDWPLYYAMAPVIKGAAAKVSVPIEWGGNWTSFKDGPHWQLPWGEYPERPPTDRG